MEREPENLQVRNKAGSAARGAGEFEKAVRIWKDAIELDPEAVDICYNVAFTLQNDLREFERAIPDWSQVLKYEPEDVNALRQIVVAGAEAGESELEDYWRNRLLALEPDN